MKLLFIGHYKESSGWSQAAINNILALDSVGIDVVCRNIKLTDNNPNVPKKILELEQKELKDIDYCIQHVLPHHITATSKFKKNIAYFVHESTSIKHNSWFVNLQQVDEIWVPNSSAKQFLELDGIQEEKLKIVHHPFDIFEYQTEYPKFNFHEFNDYFKFYTIADINDRKNIDSIIKCFYSEFTSDDKVCLILKIKKYGMEENQTREYVQNKLNEIKHRLRIHKNPERYPLDIIVPQNLDNKHIYSLHSSCDCFVGISHGEGWSIPAFEAMCFGKTPICSNEGGPKEFIDENDKSTGFLVDGVYNVCDHSDPAFPMIFTGNEEWFVPSESETKKAMRYYYENRDSINRLSGIKRGRNFTFEKIGNTMKEYLND
jgi:glycosyltransferase involved in cell wall biosynthesis